MIRGMKHQKQERLYRLLALATIGVLVFGTVFYHYIEGWGWVDSYYFCVVTLTTIGYGNFIPQTDFAKIFTTFYIFVGIGIIGAFLRTFLAGKGQQILEHRKHRTDHNQDRPSHKPLP